MRKKVLHRFLEWLEANILVSPTKYIISRDDIDQPVSFDTLTQKDKRTIVERFVKSPFFPIEGERPVRLKLTAISINKKGNITEKRKMVTFANITHAKAFLRGIRFAVRTDKVEWENVGKTHTDWLGGDTDSDEDTYAGRGY